MTPLAANVNELALGIFALIIAITLAITYWASKRTHSATEFWAAGRGITGVQNGFAIAGDYMSAASFLGIAGLIFLFGFDGFLYAVGFLVAFLTVLFLLAERMRNAGKYTIADVLSFRLNQRPARAAAALGTLAVAAFYLIAQMVGAGVLIQALVGIQFWLAVVVTGVFMLCYVVFGGMIATTWVQIIKAALLLAGTFVLALLVLNRIGWNPVDLFNQAKAKSPEGDAYLKPGLFLPKPVDTVSLGLALVLGTAGLPHILMRFFTVPDAKAARSSVVWAMFLIGAFYLMVTALGFGARAVLGQGGEEAAGKGGNLAAPLLAQALGGGEGTVGGDLLLAFIAAVAFATILAVVAGLVISASGAVAHDVWSNIVRHDRDSEHEEVVVARLGAERLVHGRAGVRRRGERQLPGAPARAHVAALQHDRRRHGRPVRRGELDRARDHEPGRLARPGLRGLAVPAGQPGDHLDPARVPRLLAGYRARPRVARGADVPRAVRALGDRHRGGAGADALTTGATAPPRRGRRRGAGGTVSANEHTWSDDRPPGACSGS
jgi:cation/acetate symporter